MTTTTEDLNIILHETPTDDALAVVPDTADAANALEVIGGDLRYWIEQAILIIQEGGIWADSALHALKSASDAAAQIEQFGEQALSILAGAGEMIKTLVAQRDAAMRHADQAFADGIEHAYECEACMSDAEVEFLANAMLEQGVSEVALGEQENLNQVLKEAAKLADFWSRGEQPPDDDPDGEEADES